jgi:hypothetical protein
VGEEVPVLEQAVLAGVRQRPFPVLLHDRIDLLARLVGVDVHGNAEVAGLGDVLLEEGLADGRQRVWHERRPDPTVGRPVVLAGHLDRLGGVVVGRLGALGDRDDAVADPCAEARPLDHVHHLGNVEVHVSERCHAGFQHLHDAQFGAGPDVRGLEDALDRPDVLAEPRIEGFVVGVPAEERHRRVGMSVDETGDNERSRTVEPLVARPREVTHLEHLARVRVDEDVRALDREVRSQDVPAGEFEGHTRT